MPTLVRWALLDKVAAAGTWLIEDDPYLPLQFDGPVGPSLLELYGHLQPDGPYRGPVVYLGTLSKSLVPGLRVGWIVAAPEMIDALVLAKQSSDLSGSMLTQAIALELLETGREEAHIPAIVHHYRERRDALCDAADAELSEWERAPGGMFVWMRSRNGAIDTDPALRDGPRGQGGLRARQRLRPRRRTALCHARELHPQPARVAARGHRPPRRRRPLLSRS